MSIKSVKLVLILTLVLFFAFSYTKQVDAFSSVIGEGSIFPGGSIFPSTGIFPGGSLFPKGIFPNGQIFINGSLITQPFQRIVFHNHRLFITGFSAPNVKVKLLFHSKPLTVEAITNSNGYWSYEIPNFSSGNHTLAMAIEDHNGITTKSTRVATFAIPTKDSFSLNNSFPLFYQLNFLTISLLVIGTMGFLTFFYSAVRLYVKHE
jgi:hypothetical protein